MWLAFNLGFGLGRWAVNLLNLLSTGTQLWFRTQTFTQGSLLRFGIDGARIVYPETRDLSVLLRTSSFGSAWLKSTFNYYSSCQ